MLISVVLPVRDGAAFLDSAVSSVLAQSDADLELVVVDDGSTDRTPQILSAWAGKDERLRVVSQPPGGLAAALRAGCATARGELIARLDADDEALPHWLARHAQVWVDRPGLGLVVSARLEQVGREQATRHGTVTGHDELVAALEKGNVVQHSGVTFSHKAFDAVGGYRAALWPAEDYDLWLRLTERFPATGVGAPCVLVRYHPGQVTAGQAGRMARAAVAARSAARLRRAGRPDPLDASGLDDPAVRALLGLTPARVAAEQVALESWYARKVRDDDPRTWARLMGTAARHRDLHSMAEVAQHRADMHHRRGRRARAVAHSRGAWLLGVAAQRLAGTRSSS